ncbi:MAG: N-glycosylase/DNA lyase [Nitrospirota bacterium]|nr:N-glycosylase/DNA lyase [Nitrospirota bacterium]MDH5768323.1 N-glycosylase/DNA lyase [Nitrospirota bacterium]
MNEGIDRFPLHAMNTRAHLKKVYSLKRHEICSRLKEFKKTLSERSDEEIFKELAFCILTPQSHAKACWNAVVMLKEKGLLFKGDARQIRKGLHGVRFHNKKSEYIVRARKFFMNNGTVCMKHALSQFRDICKCREWLVKNINGLGYKEASHFLRNIGFGEKIAILDRHILKNLRQLGIIAEIPQSMSRTRYFQIEKNMVEFARQIGIPVSHLDLLFWFKETGEIFK